MTLVGHRKKNKRHRINLISFQLHKQNKCPVNRIIKGGGVRVCGDAVLRYFWCDFVVIFILTRGIAVSKH